ncbi:hypothetical protein M5D96_013298, partial [Drosophila gunungcola]
MVNFEPQVICRNICNNKSPRQVHKYQCNRGCAGCVFAGVCLSVCKHIKTTVTTKRRE